MIFLRKVYRSEIPKKKRGVLTVVADAFAAVVIIASMMFLVYDSLYLLKRYVPALVRKVKSRTIIDPDSEEFLQGKTISLVKGASDASKDPDD